MSVTLRKIKNKDGSTSQYLDIYHAGKRYKEFLKQCKLHKPANPLDKKDNSDKLALAKRIAVQRAAELQSNDYSMIAEHKGNINFIEYFGKYLDAYTKKDKRNMKGVYSKFEDFMKINNIRNLTMKQLSEDIVEKFSEYLEDNSEGEGAASYFARFKKMLKYAVREKALLINPAQNIIIKRDEGIKKDVLTMEEIQQMAGTPISNIELQRAFIFSCFTALAWVDIRELRWMHINLQTGMIKKDREKTKKEAWIAMHPTAIELLPEKPGEKDEYVFPMYSITDKNKRISHTGALKTLRMWSKKAGIEKHITWHCARHSAATNLVIWGTKNKNLNLLAIKNVMGHATLKYTERYVRPAEEMMKETINNLPAVTIKTRKHDKEN
jgi:integrase/recombinase XerD